VELILVRHPRPVGGEGICYGSSDLGVADEELSGALAVLRALDLPGAAPVVTSPLSRCALLAARLSDAARTDARLAEMDFGAWERRRWDDIPRAEIDAWAADLLHHRPGGGVCVLGVARRVAAALDGLRALNEPQVLVVCHAGTIRLLATLATGLPVDEAARRAAVEPHRIPYGGILRLHTDPA
jgi:alpha-ribazole phosphatase